MHIKHTFIASLLLSLCVILVLPGTSRAANDIDDVETDVDAVMSDSEAAQSEAVDQKKRAKEENEAVQKLKREASTTMATAKEREITAKITIKELDNKIIASKTEQRKYSKQIAIAKKQIADAQVRITARKADLEKATAEKDAAKSEKTTDDASLADLLRQQKDLEATIAKDQTEKTHLAKDITDLKKHQRDLEKKLVQLRGTAHREALASEKLRAQRDQIKRQVASVPTKVLVRTPKYNCDVTDQASDGGKKIGAIKIGQQIELYHLVNQRWVELQYGQTRAFAARTCF